jgi:hypothetical protein
MFPQENLNPSDCLKSSKSSKTNIYIYIYKEITSTRAGRPKNKHNGSFDNHDFKNKYNYVFAFFKNKTYFI